MLTSVQVSRSSGLGYALAPLLLGIDTAMSDVIQVKNIEGLEPVVATMATSSYGIMDGEAFGDPTIGKRNIILTLGLNPDWATQSMTELRQELYKYFMPKSVVDLEFVSTHLPTCHISGTVEDMRPNMFSADPEIVVSILCPNPDFVAVDPTVISGVSVGSALIETDVPYEGTVPAGVIVKMDNSPANTSYVNDITLMLGPVDQASITIDNVTIDATYFFEMSTVPGNKYVRRVNVADPTVYLSILNQVVGIPEWGKLIPGDNVFSMLVVESDLDWSLTYYARFGGL